MTEPVRPDDVGLAEVAATWASAYVHVPFCAAVCPYCDFAVVAGADDQADRYVAALEREIAEHRTWRTLDSVFVGGGTPSSISPHLLARILEALRSRFGLADDAEVTLEANPEDWTPTKARALVQAGFNRVSFGAQSFDRQVLAALGRRHSPETARNAVVAAREAGFGSISVDLILGHPTETDRSWATTLASAVDTGVDHVSTYGLTVEPGTVLWRQVREGAAAPDDDVQAERWELGAAVLGAAGLVRYEVSNHARPGHHCRYNLSVWGRGEYAAFGMGAHGHVAGVRSANVRRLDTYLRRVEGGVGATQTSDVVTGWDAELERLMMGLRRVAGVSVGTGGSALLESDWGRRLVEAGVLAEREGRLHVDRPLLTDEVVRAVLDLAPPDDVGLITLDR